MKRIILSTFVILFMACTLTAQTGATKPNPMDKMKFILGEWEGTGWRMTQTGKSFTKAFEKAKCRVDCNIIVVDGLGTKIDSATMEQKTVHEAFGIISYDAKTNAYSLRAYTKDGVTESVIEFLEEKVIRWNLDVPNGGKVRFTTDYKTANKWLEIGEFSRDGNTWIKFLETELTKIKD